LYNVLSVGWTQNSTDRTSCST